MIFTVTFFLYSEQVLADLWITARFKPSTDRLPR